MTQLYRCGDEENMFITDRFRRDRRTAYQIARSRLCWTLSAGVCSIRQFDHDKLLIQAGFGWGSLRRAAIDVYRFGLSDRLRRIAANIAVFKAGEVTVTDSPRVTGWQNVTSYAAWFCPQRRGRRRSRSDRTGLHRQGGRHLSYSIGMLSLIGLGPITLNTREAVDPVLNMIRRFARSEDGAQQMKWPSFRSAILRYTQLSILAVRSISGTRRQGRANRSPVGINFQSGCNA